MKTLASLIEAHRAAYSAFIHAIDRQEQVETAETKRAYRVTNNAEEKAAIAVCAYRCRTLEEARIKAEYLARALGLRDGLQAEQVEALLQSFSATA